MTTGCALFGIPHAGRCELAPVVSLLVTQPRVGRPEGMFGSSSDRCPQRVAKGDRSALAIQSIEAYRLFQESIDHRGQSVPVEVPLFDYAGFKLNALLLSTQPDRQQVADTAQEASTWWTAIGPRITDKTLETPWLAYPSTLKVSGDPMRCPKRC